MLIVSEYTPVIVTARPQEQSVRILAGMKQLNGTMIDLEEFVKSLYPHEVRVILWVSQSTFTITEMYINVLEMSTDIDLSASLKFQHIVVPRNLEISSRYTDPLN